MTRENKLVMVIGFGFLLFLGILVSDHLAASSTPINRDVVGAGYTPAEPVGLPGFPEPFPAPEPARPALPDGGGVPIVQPPVLVLGGSGGLGGSGLGGSGLVNGIDSPQGAGKVRIHKVAKGEFPSDIAKKYYGKRALGEKLAKFNGIDPSRLRIGQEIRIPDLAELDPSLAPPPAADPAGLAPRSDEPALNPMLVGGAPAPASPAESPEPIREETRETSKVRTFKVREGDTLYKIAKEVLGDASLWEQIARENRLGDGKNLKPGMVLSIRLDP